MLSLATFMGFLAIQLWMGNAKVNNNQGEGYDKHLSRHTRYVLKDYKWMWPTITVKIVNYTPQIPKLSVDISVQTALEQYAAVTSLNFQLIESGPANILLSFLPKGNLIPGYNRLLMNDPDLAIAVTTRNWTRFKGLKALTTAVIYFAEGATWEAGPSVTGKFHYIFYNIALHELGHALGLGHSEFMEAIMYGHAFAYPTGLLYWTNRVGMNVLIDDDIKAIQQHYPPLWREAAINTEANCEGDTLTLNCPKDQLLHIVTTEYGNNALWDEKEKCEGSKHYANCAYVGSTVANRCNKKNNCSIYVSTANVMPPPLGDPCVALLKALRVRYVCTTPQNLIKQIE